MDAPSVWQILEKFDFKEKKIRSSLKKCVKKFSIKSSVDLWNLNTLAHWLYVYGYDDLALLTCGMVDEVAFGGDFELWTPIEALLLLEARIYREKGDGAAAESLISKVMLPMLPHNDAFRRRLSFHWLSDKSIARYLAQNDLKMANSIRFSDLDSLIFIRELGAGKTDIDGILVDTAKAEDRINEYRQILKQV